MTLNLAETSVVKSRPSVPHGARAAGPNLFVNFCSFVTVKSHAFST